jgi:hypothetical protein
MFAGDFNGDGRAEILQASNNDGSLALVEYGMPAPSTPPT